MRNAILGNNLKLPSTWQLFQTYSRLRNPAQELQSTIGNFVTKKFSGEPISTRACNLNAAPVRIVLQFKYQISASSLHSLSRLYLETSLTRGFTIHTSAQLICHPSVFVTTGRMPATSLSGPSTLYLTG